MFTIDPRKDKQFAAWYNSIGQCFNRGLANLVGISCVWTLFGTNLSLTVNIGTTHNSPLFLLGIGLPQPDQQFVVFSIYFSCVARQLILFNKVYGTTFPCQMCNDEQVRAKDAVERITQQKRYGTTDNDGGLPVGAKPEPREPKPGSMLDWP